MLYKAQNSKNYYLKLVVYENLYFNKIDLLELKSGSKSYYAKETKQFQLDNNTGFYVIEIWKNYVATLMEDGLTAIKFGNAQTEYTRQDCQQAKLTAKCFYESIDNSKNKTKN